MKNIFLFIAVLFIAITSNAQFTSAKLTAAGLTCAMCTKAIYNSLEKIPSVDKIDTDIKNSAFLIKFKEGSSADPDALKAAVEEAGFSVAHLNLTGNFSNISVEKNAHVNIGGKIYHFLSVNKAALNGTETLTLVDKKFVSTKEFKKYEAQEGAHPCLESGKTEECCPKTVVAHNSRIYHVTM